MELREALGQIAEIREQMARGQVCRGYRSATAVFSAIAAGVAAAAQALWIPYPANDPHAYMYLWAGTALLSLLVVGIEMALRYRQTDSHLQRQITLQAAEQFAPSIVAGALVTLVVAKFAREVVWMLPAIWAILFGMGVFASRQVLPKAAVWVGRYYLLAGLVYIALTRGKHHTLSPWAMGLTFGIGQLFAAGVLYFSLERGYGKQQPQR